MLMKSMSMGVIVLATAGLSFGANRSTFEDLQNNASAIQIHSDAVNANYATNGYDWNAEHLQAIKVATNQIGKDLQNLQKRQLTPTEQRAVNRALPILQSMAADASGAIRDLDRKGRPVENNGALINADYHDHMVAVEANAAKAGKIFENLRNYEQTRGELESLEKQEKSLDSTPAAVDTAR